MRYFIAGAAVILVPVLAAWKVLYGPEGAIEDHKAAARLSLSDLLEASPHFSSVVCCSAGSIRHYCVALGRAPQRTVKVRLGRPPCARLVLAAPPTLRDDNR